ncbi:SARP family transcriptional regulator [Streptomyces sp. HC44]|uniref:SARP family transcriptional regulator n=1 Tax=Streptomyces scabichelini TaxID=2711217 RepID=A0A6G4V3F7_9ACTN|nr:BTAD domain-containing putative transcriptional regulator [Streptomyces scabichelini]NGO08410.1 SARP family transcriptional regulator [Streptomyces scabichelini]
MPHPPWPDSATCSAPMLVRLLNGFRLDIGQREVALPVHAQRVMAFLALSRPSGMSQHRTALAEQLWCDGPRQRAQASLRTAIWRIRQADDRLVHADRGHVYLSALVEIDVERSLDQAGRLLNGDGDLEPDDTATTGLVADLLPGWEEEWLIVERERIHQVRIHALVALSHRLRRLGRFIPALNAAYTAITAEPLQESARAALVEIHLAEGNVVEARRQVDQYAQLLWDEMQLTPSAALIARVPRPMGGPNRAQQRDGVPSDQEGLRPPAKFRVPG